MTDLTSLTLADAREGLTQKSFTALELTDAHLAAMDKARALNAYILETPEQARTQARAADATIARGEGGSAGGNSARHQGSVCDHRRAHHGVFEDSRRLHPAI